MKLVDDRVKLLIERMEAFPDEFTTELSRWDQVVNKSLRTLNPIEKFLIHRKWKKIQREATLHRIVTVIAEPTRVAGVRIEEPVRSILKNWANV